MVDYKHKAPGFISEVCYLAKGLFSLQSTKHPVFHGIHSNSEVQRSVMLDCIALFYMEYRGTAAPAGMQSTTTNAFTFRHMAFLTHQHSKETVIQRDPLSTHPLICLLSVTLALSNLFFCSWKAEGLFNAAIRNRQNFSAMQFLEQRSTKTGMEISQSLYGIS